MLRKKCAIMFLPTRSQHGGKEAPMIAKGMSAAYLGVAEAEALTGISRWTWRRWAYDGKIASVKLGRRLLIPVSSITELIAENTRPALER
jgi:excisionase family DNA binding protein